MTSEKILIQSSTIKSIQYFEEIQMLEVVFVRGATYTYLNVPVNVVEQFLKAESKGKYFSKEIQKKYVYQKVEK